MGTWLGNIVYLPDDGEDGFGDEFRTTLQNIKDRIEDLPTSGTTLVQSLLPGGSNELYNQTLNTGDSVQFKGVLSQKTFASGESLTVPSGRSYVVAGLDVERSAEITVERGASLVDVGGR